MHHRIGCVSFLNSKPLIDTLLTNPNVNVHFAVPSHLLDLIESAEVSTGLLSVVDFQLARTDLLLLPAGMIGCDGPTLTVRIFSRIPIEKIKTLHGDQDSHTSLILAQLILRETYGTRPNLLPLQPNSPEAPEAMVLIGDKVVNAAPDPATYPHQLDLGEAWKNLTGLPFVFAMWMIRKDHAATEGPAIAQLLNEARQQGANLTEKLLDQYAEEKHWPRELARRYFTEYLRYEVTPHAREGLKKFFQLAQANNLLPNHRPIAYLECGTA